MNQRVNEILLRHWQSAHDLPVTGKLDSATAVSLDSVSEKQREPAGVLPKPTFTQLLCSSASIDIGRKEVGRNSGKYVRNLREFCGFPVNATGAWCAIFVSYHIKTAYKLAGLGDMPFKLSRGARGLLRNITRSDNGESIAVPEEGAIAVWRRGGGWTGHVRIVTGYDVATDSMSWVAGNERNAVRAGVLSHGEWRKGLVGMGRISYSKNHQAAL